MRRATELLESTNLQIQTIAMHCGIIDVQYFSKIFKKHIGKTPKEYRETIKA
jgi:transcriptional regulator GlxA family with amidase domain